MNHLTVCWNSRFDFPIFYIFSVQVLLNFNIFSHAKLFSPKDNLQKNKVRDVFLFLPFYADLYICNEMKSIWAINIVFIFVCFLRSVWRIRSGPSIDQDWRGVARRRDSAAQNWTSAPGKCQQLEADSVVVLNKVSRVIVQQFGLTVNIRLTFRPTVFRVYVLIVH